MFKQKGAVSIGAIIGVVIGLVITYSAFSCFENVDANEILVTQNVFSGEREVYTQPGMRFVGFNKVTSYQKRAEYVFDVIDGTDYGKKLQFNDGGHGILYGKVQWEMPLDKESILKLDTAYHSQNAIAQKVVGQTLDSSIYLSGPLMSSTESAAERRGELVQIIDDQAAKGIYATRVVEKTVVDALTNASKTATVTEIIRDAAGLPKRQQGSMIEQYGVHLLPMNVRALDYEERVQKQIQTRQDAITSVQTAIAQAKRAEQDAITSAKQGEADAAKAKWVQETINAKEIALQEKDLKVSELKAKQAEQYKREQTLIGEGNAAKMAAEMQANGALDQKLQAYVEVNRLWSSAFANFKGSLVPAYVAGGSGGNGVNQVQDFMQLQTMKAAKDLGVDVGVRK